jgi:hypothetical protein
MKNKDEDWYDKKIQSIKKRKRKIKLIEDPKMRKKIRDDLKREQRASKRGVKQSLKKWIDNEINGNNL